MSEFNVRHQVATQVLTLQYIHENRYQFSIPSYQRPYVWPDEAVLKIFDDINKACIANEPNYFIGTVLTSIGQDLDGSGIYELIDGQQRTTTLMLIALAFKSAGVESPLSDMATIGKQPRLQFAIRDEVQHLLGSLAGLDSYVFPGHEAIAHNPYLNRVYAALKVLKQQVTALSEEKRLQLGDYIFNHVQWVNNTVPSQMDLNRLFATMNTTGIQLEQVDILKSKLLKQVTTDKALFDAIWVACEHMEDYFERNLRKVFPNAHWNDLQPDNLAAFSGSFFVTQSIECTQEVSGLTIMQLAEKTAHNPSAEVEASFADSSDSDVLGLETVYCRPIISFPLLLIHAYRIYLALNSGEASSTDVSPRIHENKLLETFEPLTDASESEVKIFLKTLWKVRYQFDRWIVKWVERDDSDEEQLRLTTLSRSKSGANYYITRTQKELSALVMLQSVRNFTVSEVQYWITPFIAGLIKDNITEENKASQLLEKIDNELSLTSETQKAASFKQAQQQRPELETWLSKREYLAEDHGTGFEHYWFQKLEYLLWKNEINRGTNTFKKYRITSKNSVEHVHPQQEEYKKELEHKMLHSFGNLVLLSPGENSSYSNQAVKKKMVDFEAKPHYDSLKLKAIFELSDRGENWGAEEIKQHQERMLNVLSSHYGG